MLENSHWLSVTKDILKRLIKSAPVNPHANEKVAAKVLYDKLKKAGADVILLHKEGYKDRLNVVARIEGKDPDAAKLGFLSHLDVVPPGETSKWLHPPFAAIEHDNFIWGRGAIDCLGVVATEATAFIRLIEEGFEPIGDIVFIAEADEEMMGTFGAKFLVEEHWDKVAVDYLINEGGGLQISNKKETKFIISTAEKGLIWLETIISGSSGHGSVPDNKNNAIVKASELIRKIVKNTFEPEISEEFKTFVDAFGLPKFLKSKVLFRVIAAALGKINPYYASYLQAITSITLSPTRLDAGEKENVIPDKAKITFDCRTPIHTSVDKAIKQIISIIDKIQKGSFSYNIIQSFGGSSSPINTPLYEYISSLMQNYFPTSKLVPFILTGATDSRFWREKGSIAYGFTPFSSRIPFKELAQLSHNINERIDLETLDLMHSFFYNVAIKFQQKKHPRILKR